MGTSCIYGTRCTTSRQIRAIRNEYTAARSARNYSPTSTRMVAAERTHSWQETRLQPFSSRQVDAPLAAVKAARTAAAFSGATCMAPYKAPQVPSGARPPPQAAIGSTRSSRPNAAHTVWAQLYMKGFCRNVASACSTRFIDYGYLEVNQKFQRLPQTSVGMRQSPRGERAMVPTFGPSGTQVRLNCCVKKRRRNVCSVLSIKPSSYSPAKA